MLVILVIKGLTTPSSQPTTSFSRYGLLLIVVIGAWPVGSFPIESQYFQHSVFGQRVQIERSGPRIEAGAPGLVHSGGHLNSWAHGVCSSGFGNGYIPARYVCSSPLLLVAEG